MGKVVSIQKERASTKQRLYKVKEIGFNQDSKVDAKVYRLIDLAARFSALEKHRERLIAS